MIKYILNSSDDDSAFIQKVTIPKISLNAKKNTNDFSLRKKGSLFSDIKVEGVFKHYAARMDVIRFLAIGSIVWGHCFFSWERHVFSGHNDQVFQLILLQFGRIGTIFFFIITGFFLNKNVLSFNLLSYVRYRFFSIIIPWVFFLSAYVIIETLQIIPLKVIFNGNIVKALILIYNLYRAFIFHGAYWFIPVSIVSALILIIFKNYLYYKRFGALLACITLFYSVNLYYSWIPADHTKAFLGYTFFMWIGIIFSANLNFIKLKMDQLSYNLLIPILITLFTLACIEESKLKGLGCVDPYASIRLSNAFFCLFSFLMLTKSNNMTWIKRFNPQRYVYGVYLIHCVLISELAPFLNKLIIGDNGFSNLPKLVSVHIIFFITIMVLTFILVRTIKHSKLYFILGKHDG